MSMSSLSRPGVAPRSTVTVFRLAALFTFLAVVMGSVVCATESGAACPTWPGCYPGQVTPGLEVNPLIEFTHRVVAVLAGPLVLAAAVLSSLLSRRHGVTDRGVRVLPWLALVGAIAAGVFGRLVVLTGIPVWVGVVDLGCALGAMIAMTVATVRLERPPRQSDRSGTTRAAFAALAVIVPMHLLGIVVAGAGSYTRCMGWPAWQIGDADGLGWLQAVRVALAVVGVVLVVTTALRAAWEPAVAGWGRTLLIVLAGEMLLGALLVTRGLTALTAAAYSIMAVTLVVCLALTAATASTQTEATEEAVPAEV